jgi:hypothetical protein
MSFFFESLVYLFAVCWLQYLPAEGLFLIGDIHYTGWKRLVLGITTGICLMIALSYSAGFAGVRIATPILLSLLSILAIWRRDRWVPLLKRDLNAPHLILLVFSIIFSLSVTTSGWDTGQGLIMRSANGQDGIWNIALARELATSFPPEHPAIAGVALKGYHIFYNLWIAELSRIFPLTLVHLHYHFAALTMSLLFIYGLYALALRLSQKVAHSLWAVFFAAFGGSFSFILQFIYHRNLSFDDAFGVTQPFSLLLSPSVTLSLIVIIWIFMLIHDFTKKKSLLTGFLIVVFSGICVGIKVYGGVIIMAALGLYSAYYCIFKHQWSFGLVIIVGSFVSAFCFFPFNASYGFLIYEFLWPTHQLMRGTLNFTNWDLKRETMLAMGSKRGLLKLELQAMMIFLIGNMGTRLFGLFGFYKYPKNVFPVVWLLVISLIVSLVIPMFFIQPIGVYNMIQFFWYSLVFIGVFAGIGISSLISRMPRFIAIIVSLLIISFTIPSMGWRLYYLLKGYYVPINQTQMDLYNRLAAVGNYSNVVVELPALGSYTVKELTQWYSYISLPYIPALANKRTFAGNEVVQFRYDELWKNRIPLIEALMGPQHSLVASAKVDAYQTLDVLKNTYHVRYILIQNQPVWFEFDSHFKKIFDNSSGAVYEVLN